MAASGQRIALAMKTSANGDRPENPWGLTDRERVMVGLVAEGLANKEIGDRLGLSPQTVKNGLSEVMRRMGAPNRVACAVMWTRWQILGLIAALALLLLV